ncbi:MAG: tetratricopeptide repeat protein [Candidatus Krumholzibacteriia bacterium]
MSGRCRGVARGLLVALLACVVAGVVPAAGQPSYGIDEDPIRLGGKALEQGRLADAQANYARAIDDGYQVARAQRGLAEIAVRQARLAEAETLYRAAIASRLERDRREDPEARAGLGLLLLRLGRPEDAARELDRALEAQPDNWDALYGRARLLLAGGRLDEAKALLARGAKRHGVAEGEDKYHFGMALYSFATGDPDAAEKEALIALSLDSGDPERALLVGRIYEKRGTPALAIPAFEQALATPGMVPTAPLLHTMGRIYQQEKRYNEARDSYLAAMAADSSYAPALRDLADLLRRANQQDRAARIYLRYLSLEPRDIDAQLGLAGACLELRRYDRAVEAARAALAADSTRADARRIYARAGLQSVDRAVRESAAAAFATLPADSLWTAQDWLALAEQRGETKQFDAARADVARALALEPALPAAFFQLGVIELGAGRPDVAAVALERAVALRPDAPAYHINLGVAYAGLRRTADATAALRAALRLNDKLVSARLLLAQTLAAADSLGAAEAEYRLAVAAEPGNARALRGLAWCRLRRADYGEAARLYRSATEAEPDNAEAWAGLGNAQLGSGQLDAAEQALRRARSIDPANAAMKKGFELLERARGAAPREGGAP